VEHRHKGQWEFWIDRGGQADRGHNTTTLLAASSPISVAFDVE
jgi:hypothetical protein